MVRNRLAIVALATATFGAAGCSGGGGLSTGSLFGGGDAEAAKVAAQPVNDPTARAFGVGSTAARAVKCGYNFDPVRLRTNYLSAEAASNPAGTGNLEKIYDTAFGGVQKAVGGDASYCSATRTADIKEQLNKHLAGDYTPAPRKVAAAEPGLFDAVGDGNGSDGGKFGTDDWWAAQEHKAGR